MSDWQPFGYTGEPGTCLWCGRKLRHETVIDPASRLPFPGNLIRADLPGRYEDGHFCGLRCGFRFGRRLADLGSRLETAGDPPGDPPGWPPVQALLEEWSGRVPGLIVTVFTATEPIAEDQPVYPVGDTEVKGAAGTGWSYGFALHDAAAGQLLAVGRPLEEDPESALPPAGWHLECPECEHTGGGHGPRCEGTAIPRRDGNPVSAAQAVRDYRANRPCGQCGAARTKHSFADHQWRATAPRQET